MENLLTNTQRTRVVGNVQVPADRYTDLTVACAVSLELGKRFGDQIQWSETQLMEVRPPDVNGMYLRENSEFIKVFHRDLMVTEDVAADVLIVMWSNICSTEVLLSDGSLLPTKDGDIILIVNREAKHRMPVEQMYLHCEERQKPRWTFRAYLKMPKGGRGLND